MIRAIDTGSMHGAAALDVPTVALFGPTMASHHGPCRCGNAVVLRSGNACIPGREPLRGAGRARRCPTGISPRKLSNTAEARLARLPHQPVV